MGEKQETGVLIMHGVPNKADNLAGLSEQFNYLVGQVRAIPLTEERNIMQCTRWGIMLQFRNPM